MGAILFLFVLPIELNKIYNIEFSGCANVYHRTFNFSKEYLIFLTPIF